MENSDDHTPLNVDKIVSIESHSNASVSSFHISKYDVILGISIFAFVAGLSFWIFVNFML